MDNNDKVANRLSGESSPYLLQHAANLVDWYPWGDEAFAAAEKFDRPIFLSIGYSACHWCHVMAKESFENADIAAFLNDNFISVKVDREERPDVDHIYMQAVQVLTGSGGWPLSVFLTPEGLPFFGGTYFPPRNSRGLPGFLQVLQSVNTAYSEDRKRITAHGYELQAALQNSGGYTESDEQDDQGKRLLDRALENLKKEFDFAYGGFGDAPKFPEPMSLEFLLHSYFRNGDRKLLEMVEMTALRMADGGIHDQIGGGFHRYSTDNVWRAPHFEKMLYDNALLSALYLHLYQATGKSIYKDVACKTLDYLLEDMHSDTGGFYAAQDADSEGVEGKYYLWTKGELSWVLGQEKGADFARHFSATDNGNFGGSNVLAVDNKSSGIDKPVIDAYMKLLKEARSHRPLPKTDRKIIASWNGLMLGSLAQAAAVTGDERYLKAGILCAELLTGPMFQDGKLVHTFINGVAAKDGFLEDYANVIQGLLELHAITWSAKWLKKAEELADIMLRDFIHADDGLLYDSAQAQSNLFIAPRNVIDGSMPSGNSMAAMALVKLHVLTGRDSYAMTARKLINSVQGKIAEYPRGFANWLCVSSFMQARPIEITVIGEPGKHESREVISVLNSRYLPHKVIAACDMTEVDAVGGTALLRDKKQVDSHTTVYLCVDNVCRVPIINRQQLEAELARLGI